MINSMVAVDWYHQDVWFCRDCTYYPSGKFEFDCYLAVMCVAWSVARTYYMQLWSICIVEVDLIKKKI